MGNLTQVAISRQPTAAVPLSQLSIVAPTSNPKPTALVISKANTSVLNLIVTGLDEEELVDSASWQQVPAEDASRQPSVRGFQEDALERMLYPQVLTMLETIWELNRSEY